MYGNAGFLVGIHWFELRPETDAVAKPPSETTGLEATRRLISLLSSGAAWAVWCGLRDCLPGARWGPCPGFDLPGMCALD